MSNKRKQICHIRTGNGISVRTSKELLAALYIQRQHKIDKEDSTEYTFCAASPWTKQQQDLDTPIG